MKIRFAPRLALCLVLGTALSASAVIVPGGGRPKKADCYGGFDVTGTGEVTSNGTGTVTQKACNSGGTNTCTFTVAMCTNIPIAGCTNTPITGFKGKIGSQFPQPALGSTEQVCGTPTTVTLQQRGRRAAKRAFGGAVLAGVRPKRDTEKLVLKCLPNTDNAPCTGGVCDALTPPSTECPANTAGGPNEVILSVLGDGTDLDNGWTGTSHNFPVIKDAKLRTCLQECNDTNPVCVGSAPTGAGSANGPAFGPPLPLIAGGVSVCVVNNFNGPVSAKIHLDTGVVEDNIVDLRSEIFVTTSDKVCPQCLGGTCDSGSRRGQSCSIDGSVFVANASNTNRNYQLSQGCPPGATGSGVATLTIPLRPITGTSTTAHVPDDAGDVTPCRENIGLVSPQANNCGPSGCGANNCTGNACVRMVVDPTDPAGTRMACQDVKGGLSQNCCNSQTSIPCFPTGAGQPGIVRVGKAVIPGEADSIAWPEPTYPKAANGLVLSSIFCEAGTGAFNVDQVSGLPGPGAVVFNLLGCVFKTQ